MNTTLTEIEQLRALITAWADACDYEMSCFPDQLSNATYNRADAEEALRAAIGR
jgi:hypothetical protein